MSTHFPSPSACPVWCREHVEPTMPGDVVGHVAIFTVGEVRADIVQAGDEVQVFSDHLHAGLRPDEVPDAVEVLRQVAAALGVEVRR